MALLDLLADAWQREDPSARVFECRRCGTAVNADTESCPTCGSREFAVYDIE